VDPRGKLTQSWFDDGGRLTVTIDPAGGRTTVAYDVLDHPTSVLDPRANLTQPLYDALGRMTGSLDALTKLTSYLLDKLDHVTGTIDALGKLSAGVFDALGRQTVTVDASSRRTTSLYDADGHLTGTVDGLNHLTTYLLNAVGDATVTIDPESRRTTTLYDAGRHVTSLTDPGGNTTTFSYDNVGNKLSMTDPLHHTATYHYDAANRVDSQTDRDGRRIDFTRDGVGRELTETWYDTDGTTVTGGRTFLYDGAGNLTVSSDAAGTNTYTYDDAGRLRTVQEPYGLALTYSYYADGSLKTVEDNLGGVVTSVYDANGRLQTRELGGAGVTAARFDLHYTDRGQADRLTRYSDLAGTTSVGLTSYTYDDSGLLTGLEHRDGSGATLARSTFLYDLAARITSSADDGVTTTFGYDKSNQLLSAGSSGYGYDAAGNRNTSGYTTGPGNQVTSDGTWSYTYDLEGNETKKSKGASAETWTYGYDARNQLIWAEDRSTDGGTLITRVEYAYDAEERRLSRSVTVGGTTTVERFGYDGQNVWADLNGSNALVTRRLYGDQVDQVIARESAAGSVGWYLADRQGSVIAVTDGAGAILDRLTYDAFGGVTSESGAAYGDRYGYTGRERDIVTGLSYHRMRYYDPATDRWMSPDPEGFTAGDDNLYRYVGNNSTNATDPTGRWLLAENKAAADAWIQTLAAHHQIRAIQVPLGNSRYSRVLLLPSKESYSRIDSELARMRASPGEAEGPYYNLYLSIKSPDYHAEAKGSGDVELTNATERALGLNPLLFGAHDLGPMERSSILLTPACNPQGRNEEQAIPGAQIAREMADFNQSGSLTRKAARGAFYTGAGFVNDANPALTGYDLFSGQMHRDLAAAAQSDIDAQRMYGPSAGGAADMVMLRNLGRLACFMPGGGAVSKFEAGERALAGRLAEESAASSGWWHTVIDAEKAEVGAGRKLIGEAYPTDLLHGHNLRGDIGPTFNGGGLVPQAPNPPNLTINLRQILPPQAAEGLTAEEIGKYSRMYADKVNANRGVSWPAMGRPFNPAQQSVIRQYTREANMIEGYDKVKLYGPGNRHADFTEVAYELTPPGGGPLEKTIDLPEELWKLGRPKHEEYLNEKYFGGKNNQPTGWTWHHMAEDGKMQLVPRGLHSAITHDGGMSPGHWGYVKRGGD
jgi:RHS repeat-associated protein